MIKPNPERGVWREHEPMSQHVSWRAGGSARWFVRPASAEEVVRLIEELPASFIYPLGLGSNLLVRDTGWPGVMLSMHHALGAMRWEPSSDSRSGKGLIFAEAGVPSPKVARLAIQKGLAEAEWLATVPGTIGGALAMNAGCYGYETWSYVRRVAVAIPGQGYREYTPEQYQIGYRTVKMDGKSVGHAIPHYFLGAWFDFPDACKEGISLDQAMAAGKEKMKALLTRRVQTQPLQWPNAGSVFRNPEGDFAARLIELSGLKGYRLGGACVSEKHANFIINDTGQASAAEIEELIEHVRLQVMEHTGVTLVPEVRLIGE
jgi:UDP-N-acetylmuramate dehydrogenase